VVHRGPEKEGDLSKITKKLCDQPHLMYYELGTCLLGHLLSPFTSLALPSSSCLLRCLPPRRMKGEGGTASLLNPSYPERQLPPFFKRNRTMFKLEQVLQFPPPSNLAVSGDEESPDASLLVQAEGGRKV